MKITIMPLFLATAGLAAASPAIVRKNASTSGLAEPGYECNEASRVACNQVINVQDPRQPYILVCVNRGEGLKWEIQSTCSSGETCRYNKENNWAWCEPSETAARV